MMNYNLETVLEDTYLRDMECPECNSLGRCEYAPDKDGEFDGDTYICRVCGHVGSIQEDKDAKDYYGDEMLCGYDEDEKGEVNDKE